MKVVLRALKNKLTGETFTPPFPVDVSRFFRVSHMAATVDYRKLTIEEIKSVWSGLPDSLDTVTPDDLLQDLYLDSGVTVIDEPAFIPTSTPEGFKAYIDRIRTVRGEVDMGHQSVDVTDLVDLNTFTGVATMTRVTVTEVMKRRPELDLVAEDQHTAELRYGFRLTATRNNLSRERILKGLQQKPKAMKRHGPGKRKKGKRK